MTLSIIKNKRIIRALAVLFWLLVWQLGSMALDREIFLPSPAATLRALARLAASSSFWLSVCASFGRILAGFLLAQAAGIIFAVLSRVSRCIRELLEPLMLVVKATPVASFVILALVWIRSSSLSILISFLMAFPIVFQNIYEGIGETDRKMLEMAEVFRIPLALRIAHIYLPAVLPFLVSSVSLSVGLSWKAGIAAEVIGQPARSIGGALYEAKIFFDTSEMFAWTLVIILISMAFERAALGLIAALRAKLEGGKFSHAG